MPPASTPCPQAALTPTQTGAPIPVFVDDTGRRHRVVRVVGWVVGALTLAYLALLGVSLVGSPGLVPLSLPAIGSVLPGPSAPQIADATKVPHNPGELLPGDPRKTSVVGVDGVMTPAGPSQATAAPVPVPARTRTRAPATRPTPAPTSTAAHTPQGNPSPAGTTRASHTPAAHPSPKSTHASPHNVKASPTPSPT